MSADVIIIGAGMAGLVAAREIQNAGLEVTVLDKGRSVGGRLATRRIQNGQADHGAQFFTVRTDDFQQMVDDWLARDMITVWGHGWSDGSLRTSAADGHPRYIARDGMNSLARDLATGIDDIRVNVRVNSVRRTPTGFELEDTGQNAYAARTLIVTPPAPQAYMLVKNLPFTTADRAALERLEYGPCLCGLFVVEGEVRLPEPGALQDFERTVYWISDNQRKGISPDERIITLHANSAYSRAHYDDPTDELLAFFRGALQNFFTDDTIIKEEQLKKWRYSIPITTHPHDILEATTMPLIFAGDGFGGRGRVEGAYLSGLAAGRRVVERQQQTES